MPVPKHLLERKPVVSQWVNHEYEITIIFYEYEQYATVIWGVDNHTEQVPPITAFRMVIQNYMETGAVWHKVKR